MIHGRSGRAKRQLSIPLPGFRPQDPDRRYEADPADPRIRVRAGNCSGHPEPFGADCTDRPRLARFAASACIHQRDIRWKA